MNIKIIVSIIFSLLSITATNLKSEIRLISCTKPTPESFHAVIDFPVAHGDAFYHDYFYFSADHPEVTITQWQPSIKPTLKYDPAFKNTKKVLSRSFRIGIDGTLSQPDVAAFRLHILYYKKSEKKNNHAMVPIQLQKKIAASPVAIVPSVHKENPKLQQKEPSRSASPPSISATLSSLLQATDIWFIQMLLAFFLGFLLSLTPCIYPMIPITIGILQSQASSSMGRNFLLSMTYIFGIATTFALLGIVAASTGKMFGSFMNNPLVILSIIALLIYLAGSMLDLYDLYIPRFLQPKNRSSQGGSLISIFMFGAISGTVASPCLSPGLLLLLTLVTNLGNIFLGFFLLFSFGIGLGIPLLIIGTFSGSLSMLPQAGSWMVDIKQFFGFIMLATCFYFLSFLFPAYIIAWGFALFVLSVGIFYLFHAKKSTNNAKRIKNILGILAIAASVYSFFNAYKITDMHFHPSTHSALWIYDFDDAIALATNNNQYILLDVSAPYCSICNAIDKKLLSHPDVIAALNQMVLIKIDDVDATEKTKQVQKQFNIMGAPTIIIWDPAHHKELQRWGSELYDYSVEDFIQAIGKY